MIDEAIKTMQGLKYGFASYNLKMGDCDEVIRAINTAIFALEAVDRIRSAVDADMSDDMTKYEIYDAINEFDYEVILLEDETQEKARDER